MCSRLRGGEAPRRWPRMPARIPNHEQHGSLAPCLRALGDDGIGRLGGCGKQYACVRLTTTAWSNGRPLASAWRGRGIRRWCIARSRGDEGLVGERMTKARSDGQVPAYASGGGTVGGCVRARTLLLGHSSTHIIGLLFRPKWLGCSYYFPPLT